MRSLTKALVRDVLRQVGSVVPFKEIRRAFRDPGYKENEFGELKSTIRKLSEREILDRMSAKVTYDIQREEDERCFAVLDAMSPPPPPRTSRYELLRKD